MAVTISLIKPQSEMCIKNTGQIHTLTHTHTHTRIHTAQFRFTRLKWIQAELREALMFEKDA